MNTIIKLLITAISAFFISKLLSPHVQIDSFTAAIIFALVLGFLNLFVRPFLLFFSLPISILTLGLFALIVNTMIFLLADYFTTGINIDGFWWAFIFSVLLSVVTSILESIFISKEK